MPAKSKKTVDKPTSATPGSLGDKVKAILSAKFPGALVDVAADDRGKVDVYVVSGSFDTQKEPVRQRDAWQALRVGLSAAEQQDVLFVLTSTPAEDAAIKAFPPDQD